MENDGLDGARLEPGTLYLGRRVGDDRSTLALPSKHLLTHAMIVGMTGSGKTGLGTVLLEELALQGIPAIAIDPKGDLGNLMLAFPSLDAASFAPWVEEGQDPAAVAARHAAGLAEWGEDGARVARFASSVERVLYTPGSSVGRPLSLMPSLGAPPPDIDPETLDERALSVASGLLTLVGIDPDPLKSPEHTLITTILLEAWRAARGVELVELLRSIQAPPFTRLGVMDLETVLPTRQRTALAAQLNNAFASPAMAGFSSGEPLDVARLLRAADGRPRLSILSLSHLKDVDRQFFVTMLLSELIAWMRAQSGTSRLRAVLYMDEIFGYFPPVANPPSKHHMLTLLKQARAFGLGIVLSTQNPVDLDYKGLSNTGTWMLGRLQTERDKLRVLDGLESAASGQGGALDRAAMDRLLSGLAPRTFLLHSVHEPAPALMQSRWALSYLRGPLSRDEVKRLARGDASAPAASSPVDDPRVVPASAAIASAAVASASSLLAAARTMLPPEIRERFLVRSDVAAPREYRAGLLVALRVQYADKKAGVELWRTPTALAPLTPDGPDWGSAWWYDEDVPLRDAPSHEAPFVGLPREATIPATYKAWQRAAIDHVVRERPLVLATIPALGLYGRPGESGEALGARAASEVEQRYREQLAKLEAKWAGKLDRAREQVKTAERRLEKTVADGKAAKMTSGLEVGVSVLGAVLGGRRGSVSSGITRAARSAKTVANRNAAEDAARGALEAREDQLTRLEAERDADRAELRASLGAEGLAAEPYRVSAKKSAVEALRVELCWVPVA